MASSTTVCGVCDQSNITKQSIIWCFECDEGLCSECKDHHSRSKGTRKHSTVPVIEYQKIPSDIVKITQTCNKHNEKYTIYCKKHESLCCGSCIVENHMECRDYDKLADIIQNTKLSNAFYEIEQSLGELSENIQIIRKDREHNLKRLSEKKMQIKKEIKQTRITINNHLDKIQDDIIKKLNTTEVNESKVISELLNLLKENVREITEFRTNIENIKQHATDFQTFISMKELEKKVSSKDKFLESVINSERFKDHELLYNANAAMHDLATHITNFGEVKIETRPSDVVLTRKKHRQAQIMLPHTSSKLFKDINLKPHKTIDIIGTHVICCCLLPNGKMAFTFYTGIGVRVINLNGTKDFDICTEALAFDVAFISHDNTLAVTSGACDTKCITIIGIKSKKIKKIIPVDSEYYGIAVTGDKLICSAKGKGIQLINPRYNSTIDIVLDDHIPQLCYVATFGDSIYHTNYRSNSVTCYDRQGTVKWIFQNQSGVIKGLHGLSVDNNGNVYVLGNVPNNVVVLTADGQQHKEILTVSDNLFHPMSLDINRSTNQLLVANHDEKALIFTLT